jgi:enoyl-CoA hydratase
MLPYAGDRSNATLNIHNDRHSQRRYGSSQASPSTTSSTLPSKGEVECKISPVPASSGGEGTFATITIRNSSRLNSLNSTLIEQLTSTLQSLASAHHHPDLRVAIIKGEHPAGTTKTPAFTSGADIYEMASLSDTNSAAKFISNLAKLCESLRTLPCLTLAQIHGLCLGGGLELAACADFRYATAASSFSMPETKYGIPSVIHARLLPNLVGWQRAREMVYLARFYGASEMRDWGLIDKMCADEAELEAQVSGFVHEVARHGVQTMRAQKALVRVWEEEDFRTGVESGVESFARMFDHGASEPRRFMREFTERKKRKQGGGGNGERLG